MTQTGYPFEFMGSNKVGADIDTYMQRIIDFVMD